MVLDDVETLLLGSGVNLDLPVKKGFLPPKPYGVVAILQTGGTAPETTSATIYPTFSVLVRGEPQRYRETREIAEAIFNVLHVSNLGSEYVYCYANSSPLFLGEDENKCPSYSLNFRTMRSAQV